MMKLVIVDGEMIGTEYPLVGDFNSIGREEGVDIHLPRDPSISRRHAVVRKEFGKYILEDLGSTNGTFVVNSTGEEEEVIQTILSEGRCFRVGKTTMQLVTTSDEMVVEASGDEKIEFVADQDSEHTIRTSINPEEIYMDSWISVPEDWKAVEELNRKIKIFYDIGMTLNKIMDLDTLLEKVIENVFEMFPAQRGYILLFNDKSKELETKVLRYRDDEGFKKSDKIEVSKTIINQVIKEKKAILSDDARIDERFGMPDSVFLHDIRATLYCPLMLDKRISGLLCIDSFSSSHVFTENDLRLLSVIANQAAQSIENARLHQNLRRLFVSSIRALANAIEARDVYTRGHSERVTEYSVIIAKTMKIDRDEVERIRYAALLHDIGKINIREDILNKPGRLTDDEFEIMKQHPVYGARILEPIEEFKEILPFIYHHHERYDKNGYPAGLGGEEIPIASRILGVADSFDAMTSDRPYRNAMALESAVLELKKNSGTQFDPKVVSVFIEIIRSEKEWLDSIMKEDLGTSKSKSVKVPPKGFRKISKRSDSPKTIVSSNKKKDGKSDNYEDLMCQAAEDNYRAPIDPKKTFRTVKPPSGSGDLDENDQ